MQSRPLLILTGCCGEAQEVIARFAGAKDYLRKPFDSDESITRAESLLEFARRQDSVAAAGATRPARQADAAPARWGERRSASAYRP